MNDHELEELLSRYRPAGPRDDLLSTIIGSPQHELTRLPRAWPWALAAAALLTITVGLHAFAREDHPEITNRERADMDALVERFGGDTRARTLAEWIVRSETAERQREQGGSGFAQFPVEPRQ